MVFSSMKRGFACFLLVLVFVGLVLLSKPVMAEDFVEVTEVRYPTAYAIMPGQRFTVWVTVSWSVGSTEFAFLTVVIKTDPSAEDVFRKEYLIDKRVLDGKSQTIQFLVLAPDREGTWPLYAQAEIDASTFISAVVSDPVSFSVPIGNSSTIIPFATPSQEKIIMLLGLGIACVLLRYRKHPKICVQS